MSALIVPVALPIAVERFRVEHVPTAGLGVPAHITLLYPFLEPEAFDDAARAAVSRIVAARPAFDFRLTAVRQWPSTVYLAVEPAEPFEALVRDLVEAFPEFPPYAGDFPFVPHVTIVEGDAAISLDAIAGELARTAAIRQSVTDVVFIAARNGIWRTYEEFALPGSLR